MTSDRDLLNIQECIIDLKIKRNQAWIELQRISSMLTGIKITVNEIESQFKDAKATYETTDYELALIDGRRKFVEPKTPDSKRKSKPKETNIEDLTDEQLNDLIDRLGITLPETEDEDEGGDELD